MKCKTCRWFWAAPDYAKCDNETWYDKERPLGYCRIGPPEVITRWPMVSAGEMCGRYEQERT